GSVIKGGEGPFLLTPYSRDESARSAGYVSAVCQTIFSSNTPAIPISATTTPVLITVFAFILT
ncbi:TPA: hypothetical protein ACHYZK_005366, partial [Escherichia coli]